MDTNFAAVTIFTLLFAVCTARISLDPQPHCKVQESNLGFVPNDTNKPGSDDPENLLESGKDRTVSDDLTPRSEYARFQAINRRFFDESRVPVHPVHSRPHRHFQHPIIMPRSKMSHENGVTLTRENVEKFHREASSNRLKFAHEHHHRHQHNHHHHNHGDNPMTKHKFVREKVGRQHQPYPVNPTNIKPYQHKVEMREQNGAGFMKSIRKFLKHTFD
ncbi:hypothetical protein HanRHA438_Chr13g0614891 [Helianthus annuus]|nr:hypothetical protein HanIR_Chr13g0656511 [Helianthus annuus]KAJ0859640.1 hypothetical protein HanRHA438_Chr13g0614891 [Helianthus annuus]